MSLDATVVVAARGVDARLMVASGEGLALVGPNGAGKTTLIEALAGLVDLTFADISVDGVEVARTEPGGTLRSLPLRQRHIALLSQYSELFPGLSAVENVAFPLRARGSRPSVARERARELLAEVGALDVAEVRPGAVSAGQARRVALARVLASAPRLVLLDEPFVGVDPLSVASLRDVVERTLGNVTRVIATHDPLDAIRLADHIAIIDEGRVVQRGPSREMLARPRHGSLAAMSGRLWLPGTWSGNSIDFADSVLRCSGAGLSAGDACAVAIDAAQVTVLTADEPGALRDTVATWAPAHAGRVRVVGRHLWAELAYDDPRLNQLAVGCPLHLRVTGDVVAYPLDPPA